MLNKEKKIMTVTKKKNRKEIHKYLQQRDYLFRDSE